MTLRLSLALCLSCSVAALSACGDSSEPESPSLSDAVQSASDAAEEATSTAQGTADNASAGAEDQAAGEQAIASYVSAMEDLQSVAQSVTDNVSAATKTPEAKAALDEMKEAWATLDQLNPELKQQLTDLSRSKIDDLTSVLQSEADRLANDLGLPDLAEMIREATSLSGQ